MNLFSFLFPIKIYKGKTSRGTLIEIREIFGRNKLDLDGYPQSNSVYRRYWKNVFLMTKIADLSSKGNALVLGLGGGDVANIIEKIQPKWKVTFVELEQEIADIASKYFGIKTTCNRSVVIGDAKNFMAENTAKYNMIIVDLYNGDQVPKFVSSPYFLKNISSALNRKGLVIFNYASHAFNEKDFAVFTFKLSKVFGDVQQYKYIGHPFFLAKSTK